MTRDWRADFRGGEAPSVDIAAFPFLQLWLPDKLNACEERNAALRGSHKGQASFLPELPQLPTIARKSCGEVSRLYSGTGMQGWGEGELLEPDAWLHTPVFVRWGPQYRLI